MQVAPRGSAMDADSYGNSGDVEATWAMQAMDHAECHMSLLLSGNLYFSTGDINMFPKCESLSLGVFSKSFKLSYRIHPSISRCESQVVDFVALR